MTTSIKDEKIMNGIFLKESVLYLDCWNCWFLIKWTPDVIILQVSDQCYAEFIRTVERLGNTRERIAKELLSNSQYWTCDNTLTFLAFCLLWHNFSAFFFFFFFLSMLIRNCLHNPWITNSRVPFLKVSHDKKIVLNVKPIRS